MRWVVDNFESVPVVFNRGPKAQGLLERETGFEPATLSLGRVETLRSCSEIALSGRRGAADRGDGRHLVR